MAPSRTFASQLRSTRLTLALSSGTVFLCTLGLAAADHWGAVSLLLVIYVPYVWAIALLWRLLSRQRPLAPLADVLRAASRQIPDGHVRFYADSGSDLGVQCTPSLGGADHFSRLDMADLEGLDRSEAGEQVRLHVVTFRVIRRRALVWRDVWVDEAIRGTSEGEFHAADSNRQRASTWCRLKLTMLNHRTGVLVPDATELGEVVRIVQNADRTWDVPSRRR